MNLFAYLDESGTHSGSPVTIMGGWLARAEQWGAFDLRWRQLYLSRGLSHVHAKDCVQGTKEFKGWPFSRRQAFMEKCNELIFDYTQLGFVASVSDADYKEHYLGGERPKKLKLDSRYGLCFRIILTFLVRRAPQLYGEDVELHLILETGHPNKGDVLRLWDDFRANAREEHVKIVQTVTFADKRRSPGLQAADSIAYGAFQQEREPPVQTHPTTARETNEGLCVHRLHASAPVLRELKDKLLAVEAMKREHWERGRKPPATIVE